jgi:hypothetical protein
MRAELLRWQVEAEIPVGDRVADLTSSMLGDRRKATSDLENLHPGANPKFKGHECGVMIRFASHMLDIHGAKHHCADLQIAARAMSEFIQLGRDSPDNRRSTPHALMIFFVPCVMSYPRRARRAFRVMCGYRNEAGSSRNEI